MHAPYEHRSLLMEIDAGSEKGLAESARGKVFTWHALA